MPTQYNPEIQAVIDRAKSDPEFRKQLIADPINTIRQNINTEGIPVPQNLKITVLEETDNQYYFILPPLVNRELSDAELEVVAGGKCASSCVWTSNNYNCTSHC